MLAFVKAQGKRVECYGLPRNCIWIRDCIEVDVFKSLRHWGSSMRVVAQGNNLLGVDVHIIGTTEVELESYISREVEV